MCLGVRLRSLRLTPLPGGGLYFLLGFHSAVLSNTGIHAATEESAAQ